jgi:DNA-binding protein HU-beta
LAPIEDQRVQRILAGTEHPSGINELEAPAPPFGFLRDDVAGGASDGRDDGPPRPGQPVEQGGLADVGSADEHDGWKAAGHAVWGAFDRLSHYLYSSYSHPLRGLVIKVDIVNEVSKIADITKVKAEVAVDAVFDAMRLSMQRGDRIELRGFGVFQVKPRKRGIGRNPRTGKEVRIPPGRTIRFKPGKDLQNIG